MIECNCPGRRVPMILHITGCPMRSVSPIFIDMARLAVIRKRLEEDSSNDSANSNELDEILTMLGFPAPVEMWPPGSPTPAFDKDPDGDPL